MKEVKVGYKETEVGVIPEDWNLVSINDMLKNSYLLEHIDGNHGELYPRNFEFINDGIPFVGANDFKGNYVNIKKCKKLSKKRSLLFRKGFLINNDILFAHNATVGSVAIFSFKGEFGVSSTTTTCYRANSNKLNYLYLFNVLKSNYFKNQYTPVMYQSTRMQVPVLTQRKFQIPLPPTLAEQEKIATALSDTDSYIEKLEKLIEKKKYIKTGAMQELLTGKKRLPGFGKGKGTKETPVGVIPEDWEVKKLGDVLKIRHGKSQKGIESKDGLYPILATGGIIGSTDTFLYNKESVLIGRKGTIDKPQFMNTPFWTVDTLFFSEIFSGNYAKYLFYNFLLIDWYSLNEASGVPSLNAKSIEKVQIPLPPTLAEQEGIATVLSNMDLEIDKLEVKLDKYKNIKQGMMQKLLTGEIRLV
ncbi:MAG: restriction endonuclease [Leptospira sp.]|nr:MAG: restriction endonuclease [Leptospira sp.]